MKMRKNAGLLAAGFLVGMLVGTPTVQAASEYLKAVRSTQPVYVDGQKVSLEAYAIDGANYVKLRDVGQLLNVNVYWDGSAVQIDTDAPYTGQAPASALTTAPILSTPVPTSNPSAPQDVEAMKQDIVDRTNAVRRERGLNALPTDPMLMRAAQVRAEEMAATGCYSHTRPDGTRRSTATDCIYTAENIHRITVKTANETEGGLPAFCVLGWKCSPGHLQNMTQPDSAAIGVGLAKGVNDNGSECWYCVQWFMGQGQQITWVDTPKIP